MRMRRSWLVGALVLGLSWGCGDPYEEGMKAYEAGRWKEAIGHFEHVSTWSGKQQEIHGLVQEAYFNIGKEAYEKAQWQEALDSLRKLKQENPHFEEARDLIGCTFYQMGQEAYQRRELAEAKRLLNVVRSGCSHFDKAHELIERVNTELDSNASTGQG